MKTYLWCLLAILALTSSACSKRNSSDVQMAIANARAAEKEGDRTKMQHSLEAIPPDVRTPAEAQSLQRVLAAVAMEPELDLARQKSDIDQVFLSLTKIERTGLLTAKEKNELDGAKAALRGIQEMRGHLANHEHEAVVQSADIILSVFPDNVEAKKAFTESGVIFSYLEAATQAARQSILKSETKTSEAKATHAFAVRTETTTVAGLDPDPFRELATQFSSLATANKFLDEAIKRDSQYRPSLALKAWVHARQNVLAGSVAKSITETCGSILSDAESTAVDTYNTVNKVFRSPYEKRAPWDIYAIYGYKNGQLYPQLTLKLGSVREVMNLLKQVRNDENASYVDAALEFAGETPNILSSYLQPTGSWKDYSAIIDTTQNKASVMFRKLTAEITGYSRVITRDTETADSLACFQYLHEEEKTTPILAKHKTLIGNL